MNTSNTGHDRPGRITSLSDLPQDIAPPRDLWPAIEAAIAAESRVTAKSTHTAGRTSRMRLLAMAAVVCALAVGIWVGRSVLPGAANPNAPAPALSGTQAVLPASFVTSPRYAQQRAALLASFETQVRSLPPQSQHKVLASLASIHKSMTDIQAALGTTPGNGLLQEMLVNTYQDEMRVLTAVHEAGDARKEI